MKYLSLFSGIEAATVAWKPMGWEAVAYAEIDKHPSEVLTQHYPDTPNFGDVANLNVFELAKLGQIDLIIFGSPCQDLSVAGKGAGLNGERSGLFRTAMLIADHCIKHNGTRFVLWENVPGAYSSNKGSDFSEVVGSMAGLSDVEVPAYGWGKEGVALGDKGLLEWSCLDAQFFGLAQRRKRVFALLDTGDWAGRPPILLERESLRGDYAPCRETSENTTANARGSVASSDPARSLRAQSQDPHREDAATYVVHGTQYPITSSTTAHALGCNSGQENAIAYSLAANTIGRHADAGGNGDGFLREASYTITVQDRHVVQKGGCVRKLTPLECERLQGFPDNYTSALSSSQRYMTLGNSMAVPVIQYIGLQIEMALRYQHKLEQPK